MATIEPLRSDALAASADARPLGPADFRSGREENRLTDLLAFALAAEAGTPPTPEEVERLRRQAEAELHDHAFRLLHNRIEEIRREAVAEQLAHLPRPLGFGRTMAACLAALAVAALAAGWLQGHPETLGRLLALFGG